MPGPIRPEEGFHHGSPPPDKPLKDMKTAGKVGELLEGSVYYFKLNSLGVCSDEPVANPEDPKSRVMVGAEIEVSAKEALNVSPRDLRLGIGGIAFTSEIKPKQEFKRCKPLLAISHLRANQTIKGFVLFELPTTGPGSNLKELSVVYQPTRFGGASQVLVPPEGK